MVKHTQTLRWQKPTSYLIEFDHFVGLALTGLIEKTKYVLETKSLWEKSLANTYFIKCLKQSLAIEERLMYPYHCSLTVVLS